MARAAARPSEPGIFTSRITRSGWWVADQLDGLVPPAGLPHHVVALVQQDLLEIEPDDRFVLGDDHTPGHGSSGQILSGSGTRRVDGMSG